MGILMRSSRLVRRLALLVCIGLPLLSALADSSASPESSSGGPPAEGKGGTMTMEQWRAAKDSAEAAIEAPMGDEKIALCRAFIAEHPDYPNLSEVLRVLITAYVDKGNFDRALLASLLERLSGEVSLQYSESPEYLVDVYYFKYNLPLDSAERLLQKARSDIAAQKLALDGATPPLGQSHEPAVEARQASGAKG